MGDIERQVRESAGEELPEPEATIKIRQRRGFASALSEFYDVSSGSAPLFIAAFAIGNFFGPCYSARPSTRSGASR